MADKSVSADSFPEKVLDPKVLEDINREYIEGNVTSDMNIVTEQLPTEETTPQELVVKKLSTKKLRVKVASRRRNKVEVDLNEPLLNIQKRLKSKQSAYLSEESDSEDSVYSATSHSGDEGQEKKKVVKYKKKLRLVARKNLTKKAKLEAIVEVQEDSDDELQEIPAPSGSRNGLQTRVPPVYFIGKVLVGLTELQKAKIREIGFGSLLDLSLDFHRSDFAAQLVSAVNVNKCSIKLGSKFVKIEREDVELVYGLPLGGIQIEEPVLLEDKRWREFWKSYKALFPKKTVTPVNKDVDQIEILKEKAKKDVEDGKEEVVPDEFVWHFLMCAVNCCMRSTSNNQLNYKFLYNCMDVNRIAQLDWCTFVYKSLFESVEQWKNGAVYFTERMKKEKGKGVVFGDGTILPRMERAVKTDKPTESEKVEEKSKLGEGSLESPNDMENFLSSFHELAKKIANDVNDIYLLLGKAQNLFEEEAIGVQMSSFVQNIFTKFSRSAEHSTSKQKEKQTQYEDIYDEPEFLGELDAMMKSVSEKYDASKAEKEKLQRSKSQMLNDLVDPNFNLFTQDYSVGDQHENVVASPVDAGLEMDVEMDVASKPEKEKLQRSKSPGPIFNLLSQDSLMGDQAETVVASPVDASFKTSACSAAQKDDVQQDVDMAEPALDVAAQKGREEVDTLLETPEDAGFQTPADSSFPVPETQLDEGPQKDANAEEKHGDYEDAMSSDDDLQNDNAPLQKREKRIIKVLAALRSPFLVESNHLLTNVPAARRRVLEYALHNGDPDEMLYYDSLTMLNRDEIQSLSGKEHVASSVVDAWSLVLNAAERDKGDRLDVKRFFFTTNIYILSCTNQGYAPDLKRKDRLENVSGRLQAELDNSRIPNLDGYQLTSR